MDRIYMDNAATTRVKPEVRDAMLPFYDEVFGNPSTIYYYGREAHKALDHARQQVAAAIGADKDPNTANNGFNYNFGRWSVIVWPYLNQFIAAGTSPWILLDKRYNDEYGCALWLDRVALEVRSELSGNDANVWKGYARFTAGFNDWRGFAVGGVSGGTQLVSA